MKVLTRVETALHGAAVMCLGAFLVACGGEVAPAVPVLGPDGGLYESATSVDAIRAMVERAGLPSDDVEVDGDVVRVDGDIILSASGLVAGDYLPRVDLDDDSPESLKGYRSAGIISNNRERNIVLRWGAAPNRPGTRIRNAFKRAGLDWSAGSDIDISVNNSGREIRVFSVPRSRWLSDTPCGSGDLACADFPSGGSPGARIFITSDLTSYWGQCTNWGDGDEDVLDYVARHEFGHALGLTHWDGTNPIPGTFRCRANHDCRVDPGYQTIMYTGRSANSDCKIVGRDTLSNDDRNSAEALYD